MVYVLIVDNRQGRAHPFVFGDLQRAIEEGRGVLRRKLGPASEWNAGLGEQTPPAPWKMFGYLDYEGSSLWVVECALDAPVTEEGL